MIYWLIGGFLIAGGLTVYYICKTDTFDVEDLLISILMGLLGALLSLFLCFMASLFVDTCEPAKENVAIQTYEIVPIIEVHPEYKDILSEEIYAIKDANHCIIYIRDAGNLISKETVYFPDIKYQMDTDEVVYQITKEQYVNPFLRGFFMFDSWEKSQIVLPNTSAIYTNPISIT